MDTIDQIPPPSNLKSNNCTPSDQGTPSQAAQPIPSLTYDPHEHSMYYQTDHAHHKPSGSISENQSLYNTKIESPKICKKREPIKTILDSQNEMFRLKPIPCLTGHSLNDVQSFTGVDQEQADLLVEDVLGLPRGYLRSEGQ